MGRWMPEGFNFESGFIGEYPWGLPFTQFFEWRTYEERARSKTPCRMLPTVHSISCNHEFDAYQEDNINILVPSEVFFNNDNLHWDAMSGYKSDSGKLYFTYPAAIEAGPPALLVDIEYLSNFLEKNDLVLMWTILAEKQCVHGFTSHNLGYAEHSRAHLFAGGEIKSSRGITNRVKP